MTPKAMPIPSAPKIIATAPKTTQTVLEKANKHPKNNSHIPKILQRHLFAITTIPKTNRNPNYR